MKKFLSYILVLAMCLTLIPFYTVSAMENYLFSDSFEYGVNWSINNENFKDMFIVDESTASEGKCSLKVVDNDTSANVYISSDRFAVEAGKMYKVSFDARVLEGTRAKIYIQFFDADGKRVYNNSMYPSGADWKNYTFVHETPENTTEALFVIMAQDSTEGITYYDNIKLEEIPQKTAELSKNLQTLKPGDILEIEDGVYNDIKITLAEQADAEHPIIIRAKNPGKVIIKGDTQWTVKGTNYIFEGLRFEECNRYYIFYFDATSKDCTVSECSFYNNAPLSGAQFWIVMGGKATKIKKCFFSNKNSVGQMVCANESPQTLSTSNNHLIEDCYFGNIAYQSDNGFEAIRMGRGDQGGFADSRSVIQGCFFEKCDGEAEIISVKSDHNDVRYNTLYNSKGAICLRHGSFNSVYGNLFVGSKEDVRNHGVRVIGEGHKVYNNYFFNQSENSTTLSISDGCPYENIEYFYYYPVTDAEVYNNTFIGGDKVMQVGKYSPSTAASSNMIIAPQGKVSNNAVISYTGNNPLIENGDAKHQVVFENNYAYGKELGYEGDLTGINNTIPDYQINEGYVEFENGIGADIKEVKKAPTSPFDIISDWVKREYYDTGIVKFEPVEWDVFNTEFKNENLLPDASKINVVINGYVKGFDVDPQIINSRTMVPMRAIFEEFGANVGWDESTATATATLDDIIVKITRDSATAYINDNADTLDSPAVIVDGRFLVPLRFVSESFGAKVGWAVETQTAVITYKHTRSDGFDGIEREVMHNIANAIPVMSSFQSGDDGAGASIGLIYDGSYTTRWGFKKQDNGEDGYGIIELDSVKELDSIYLGFYSADKRTYTFSIYVSDDNKEYTPVAINISSTTKTKDMEKFDLNGAKGKYIKIVGHGNSQNEWNNITELVLCGSAVRLEHNMP